MRLKPWAVVLGVEGKIMSGATEIPWSLQERDEEAKRWNEDRHTFFVRETATHIVELKEFNFTWAILLTPKRNKLIYDNRWCYASFVAAALAAEVWDPQTQEEPVGWHRHPGTGRRRTHGADDAEYVNW